MLNATALNVDRGLISVIMPAYNAVAFIAESIRSVLGQDYQNIELIVVDDGSIDGTPDIARQFGERVIVLSQKNAGPAAARNLGIAAAKGDYVAFLDADDIWPPGKLSLQVDYLDSHPDINIIYGIDSRWYADNFGNFRSPSVVDVSTINPKISAIGSGWIYKELLLESIVHIITVMIRREALRAIGEFRSDLPIGEDYNFWLRASRLFQFHKFDCTLAYYRIHPTSITKIPRKINFEYKVLSDALAQYGRAGPDNVPVDAKALQQRIYELCFSHGYMHIRTGDAKVARQAFAEAFGYASVRLKWKIAAYWFLAVAKGLAKSNA